MKYKRKKPAYPTRTSAGRRYEKRLSAGKVCSSVVIVIFLLFAGARIGFVGSSKTKSRFGDARLPRFVVSIADYIAEKTEFISDLGKKGAEFCFGYLRGDSEEKERAFAKDESESGQKAVRVQAASDAESSSEAVDVASGAEPAFLPVMPCMGEISSPYGERAHPVNGEGSFHNGVDIAANSGDEVIAAESGVVEKSTYNQYSGNFVVIRHIDDYTSSYAHLSKVTVKEGDSVNRGDVIGYVGSTGVSTGPHLHWEIRKNGEPLNPIECVGGERQ